MVGWKWSLRKDTTMNITASKVFFGVAFAFGLIATLTAAGHATGFAWALPAAIASLAFAFLVA